MIFHGGDSADLCSINCSSPAVGHGGPHKLQHLLSRASWDDQRVLHLAADWAVLC